jgi:glycosyltransferase involved in cell wall biosynthesis
MKIIFFCQFLYARDGSRSGHTSLLRQFIPQLIERGHDVEVFALAGLHSVHEPCKVHIMQKMDHRPEWGFIKKILFWMKIILGLIFFVAKKHRKFREANLVSLTAGASCVLPLFFKNVFIWENVAYLEKRPVLDKVRLRLMSARGSIVVVPTVSERNMLQNLSFPLNVKFVRNWFSPKVLRKVDYNIPTSLKFMSAGLLQRRKGFDLLIEAVNVVKYKIPSGVEFHIYGDGPDKKDLSALISRYGLENYIVLKGFKDGLEEVYCQYDVFILPSRLEGFPLVMIDSLAAGLPCIAFDCPTGPGQIVKTGYNGFLVDNGKIAALAFAIVSMLNNIDIVNHGRAAVDSVENYDINEITERWISMMSNIKH